MVKVIVTGGAGFIGGHVVEGLRSRNFDVVVVDNLSKGRSIEMPGMIYADLRDAGKAEKIFKGADICINLASRIGGIGYFHKYPAEILDDNSLIYSSTFNAAVKNRIRQMIYVSSSMVYENTEIFPARETDLRRIPPPSTGYGFSKLVGEYYCRMYREQHGLHYTIIRPFNAYGINEYPGDETGYSHVIPDLVKKIREGQYPLEILGDGQQTRCFTHVKDIALAIILCIDNKGALDEDFNVGNPEEVRIIDLAKDIWDICGKKEPFKTVSVPGFMHDVRKRVPSVAKAKQKLGWAPAIKFRDGLRETVEWLMKHG